MTDKELRKLNRAELLELLLEQSQRNDQLEAQLAQAEERLKQRQLQLDEAGSIAEASLKINQVFQAAQEAADQYLENIQALSGRQEAVCAKLEAESRQKAGQLLAETEVKCKAMEAETVEKCTRMTQEAEAMSKRTWEEAKKKLDDFIDQQAGLRELLRMISGESMHS